MKIIQVDTFEAVFMVGIGDLGRRVHLQSKGGLKLHEAPQGVVVECRGHFTLIPFANIKSRDFIPDPPHERAADGKCGDCDSCDCPKNYPPPAVEAEDDVA